MLHQEVLDRLIEKHPEAVMVRAALEHALPPTFVDEVFERVASKQYTRKLLFSTLVRLLSLVVCRVRPSVFSAFQFMEGQIQVIAKTVYNKLNGCEMVVAETIVAESAQRLAAVVDEMDAPLKPLIPGWKTRILDGNHLASTQHRLKELRTLGGGALPGQALVIFDADRGLVSQVYLCEDGHSQEREIMLEALGEVEAGEVWIADRNFATAVFMHQVHVSGGRFIVRRHQGNGRVREVGPWRWIAESETGTIEERCVVIEDGFGGDLEARSIRVRLKKQTRDGDREIELLTDLPTKITAELIAAAYRQRWRIETAFADLDRVFEGEIESLGHPQAALLAFALALVAYNTLGVVQAALRAVHGAEKVKNEVSPYYLGLSTAASWSSLELFHDAKDWTKHFARKTASQMARLLVGIARKVNLAKLKKHPRGPKKPQPARQHSKRSPHFATSRVLAKRK